MLVKNLSNSALVERFNKLVRTERKITHLVLECIAEIDHRQLYLQKAYSSLYDYLIKEFGYSPSAAHRRISSARLLRDVPEMAEKIESGSLNLSQLTKVQHAIRNVQKTEKRKMAASEKREILNKIQNTTQEKTELILVQELNLPVDVIEKEKIHRDESVTLTMTLSKDQMELLQKVGDLISHAVPEKKWAQVISYLAKKELDRRTKKETRGSRTVNDEGNKTCKIKDNTAKLPKRQPIPARLRKTILHLNAKCEFQDPHTGKLCESQRFLQIDHIYPVWAGGGNQPENLRTLCALHNQFRYTHEAGFHP